MGRVPGFAARQEWYAAGVPQRQESSNPSLSVPRNGPQITMRLSHSQIPYPIQTRLKGLYSVKPVRWRPDG